MFKGSSVVQALQTLPIFVVLDSIYSKNENSPISTTKPAAMRYSELLQRVDEVLLKGLAIESAVTTRNLPFTTIFSIAEMIILSTTKTEDIFLQVMNPRYVGNFIPCHSLNVAFLSCKVGMGLKLSYKELNELCVAAILHDIGMTKIAPDCFYHDRPLSKHERSIIESHPTLGYDFFVQTQKEFPWLSRVILEEHKRENNQGYPASVNGALHIYSKIIGLCDSYEALTHERHYRKACHPADAIKSIINEGSHSFAKEVLKGMIDFLSLYPVGSLVQLNNKKISLVIEAIPGSPLRPKVRSIRESTGADISDLQETFDLSKDNTVYVTGLVYDDNYEVPEHKTTSR